MCIREQRTAALWHSDDAGLIIKEARYSLSPTFSVSWAWGSTLDAAASY